MKCPPGVPTGHFNSHGVLIPSPPAAHELNRIQQLLADHPLKLSQTPGHTITLTARRLGTLRYRSGHCLAKEQLEDLFSAGFVMRDQMQDPRGAGSGTRFLPDSLGLDPKFWASVILRRGTPTLTSHHFRIES